MARGRGQIPREPNDGYCPSAQSGLRCPLVRPGAGPPAQKRRLFSQEKQSLGQKGGAVAYSDVHSFTVPFEYEDAALRPLEGDKQLSAPDGGAGA